MEEPEQANETEKWSNYVDRFASSIRNNPDDDEHSLEVSISFIPWTDARQENIADSSPRYPSESNFNYFLFPFFS